MPLPSKLCFVLVLVLDPLVYRRMFPPAAGLCTAATSTPKNVLDFGPLLT